MSDQTQRKSLKVSEETHRRVKKAAVEAGIFLEDFVENILNMYLDKKEEKDLEQRKLL